jgi:hypothetical protein
MAGRGRAEVEVHILQKDIRWGEREEYVEATCL